MKSTKIPPYVCECGYETNTTVAAYHEAVPTSGDLSVCLNCARLTIFNSNLTLRPLTSEELSDFRTDPKWYQVEMAQKAVLNRRSNNLEN